MRELKWITAILAAGLLMMAAPALAQVQVGNETSLSLNGTVSAGYSGSYGDGLGSAHGIGWGGTGELSGYYFSPSFLSFNLTPYFNQSRENSNFQSISNTSGLNGSATIFSGSKFPGWINYSDTYNNQGNYAVPGLADYTTHGNGRTFGIGWSENIADLPSLSVGFQKGSNHYSLYGTNTDSTGDFRSFNLSSAYSVLGFHLHGGYQNTNTQTELPQLFATQTPEKSNTGTNTYSFSVSHSLPFTGSVWASASKTSSNYGTLTSNGTNNFDLVNSGMAFNPTKKWNVEMTSDYTNNLIGELNQSILEAGGTYQETTPSQKSESLMVEGTTTYSVNPNLRFSAGGSHRVQTIFGESYGANTYSGSAAYSHMLMGGTFSVSTGLFRTTLDYIDQPALGVMTSVGYSHRIQAWTVNGSFNYAQNQQRLLVNYMSTSYTYSGSVGRQLSKVYVTLNANGSENHLTSQNGSSTFGQGYSANLSSRWLSASGAYNRSSGNAIQTGAGLTPVIGPGTIYPIITPTQLILYGGTSYSFGVGSTPKRGLTANANYTHARSNTLSSSLTSNNTTEMLNVYTQYQLRKVYLTAGYSSLTQDFTVAGPNTNHIKSYYVGISRWFNFF